MADRQRQIQRYRIWMTGSNAAEERKKTAYGFRTALLDRQFDSSAFEDLIALLNHEFLCVKLGQAQNRTAVAPFIDSGVLSITFIDALLQDLAEYQIRSLSEAAYLERELQFRALIATFTLLHAKGVGSFESDFYDSLGRQLEARFRDLQWHPGTSNDPARFSKIQCSYLLSAAAEYFARFRQAQPLSVNVASRVMKLLSFGISAASPAYGGGPGNLQQALDQLNNGLKAISRSPNERYSGLFALQEFTRLAVALQTYHDVVEDVLATSWLAREIKDRSQYFTRLTLKNVASAIAEHRDYESDVTPPLEFWANFQAAASRGPPSFNLYYYLYGVVDCAAQVCKISDSSALPSALTNKMTEIVLSDGEASHRWKALEYCMAAGASPDDVARSLLSACHPAFRPRLYAEIDSLTAANLQNITRYSVGTQGSRETWENEEDSLSLQRVLSSRDWLEPEFGAPKMDESSTIHKIIPKSKDIIATGLSPSVCAVFALEKKSVHVYTLLGPPWRGIFLTKQKRMQKDLIQAALSDKYIATISQDELQVTGYEPGRPDENPAMAFEKFNPPNPRPRWNPRCLALHDAGEKTWVVVAAEVATDGQRGASIRAYEVTRTGASLGITKSVASFNRPSPDPLKSDQINSIAFSPNGEKLVCVTAKNRILAWSLPNDLQPQHAPFEIVGKYTVELGARGITSATLFQSPNAHPYVLCTTWPSSEREKNGGEWSFVSAVASQPSEVPRELLHELLELEKAGPMIAGAASPDGRCIALLGRKGEVKLFPLKRRSCGGVKSQGVFTLKQDKLASQNEASPAAMRFRYSPDVLELFVAYNCGMMLYKRFEGYQASLNMASARPSLVSTISS